MIPGHGGSASTTKSQINAGLVFDNAGNLYGTASGGIEQGGIIFELMPNGSGWTENVLYSFTGGNDGSTPEFRPIVDRVTGVLYGTTTFAGANNGGTVYELQP